MFVFFLFLSNIMLFLGPMLAMGISQIRGYEPGDAEWGVKLEHVRGQAEAKEEVRRIVTLWESGEAFEKAGGKRERGLLFLGAPGTGKTMLAKALATGFNSPFVSIPGSGFAQAFVGIDAVIVRWLARKAKKLARKWGGQCIVFIDEIDAVGMRRQALRGQNMLPVPTEQGFEFYGPFGAINPSGDLIHENAAWREHMFALRAPERQSPYPGWMTKVGNIVNQGIFPGMMGGGGQLALNQLLVVMDGIDNPPFMRRFLTNRVNSFLDAVYVVPRRLGRVSLRLPRPRPLGAQIYFIGATNVPIENLDPALTRPGRMGRHVWFRTPTKDDRKDIFDLYLDRVSHDADLDTPERRDEIARITNGYSPAMIEQICSMALTNAHHEGKLAFTWQHLVDAMTGVEAGTAVGVQYTEEESRSVAIHEAGHAATAHVYRPEIESSRISIKMRGGSLGHHQTFDREERFSRWQSEDAAGLIHIVGAMAAEHVFYGENSRGVGGDLGSATQWAATMVGVWGMAPDPLDLSRREVRRRERRGDARAVAPPVRADRVPPDEPHAGERRLPGRSGRIRAPRSVQGEDRRRVPRARIRDRVRVRPLQQGRGGGDRRRGAREEGDLRRRPEPPARLCAAKEARDRLAEGGVLATDLAPVEPVAPTPARLAAAPRALSHHLRTARRGARSRASPASRSGPAARSTRLRRGPPGGRTAAASARRRRSRTTSAARTTWPRGRSSST